ncbi:MAG: hypothetical protein ACR2JU_15205 [Nocardioidaceae bacterium]
MLPADDRPSTSPIRIDGVERWAEDATAAAGRARVVVRGLETTAEMAEAAQLVKRVWRSQDTSALEANLLRALEHTGNFVAGAFEGSDSAGDGTPEGRAAPSGRRSLVGLSVGFLTATPEHGLHSHITCTAPGRGDAGLGTALKLYQRAWALAAGLTSVTWTVDPLVGRNNYFNFAKLGARAVAYLPDFYGPMADGLNAGDETDRLLMSWALSDPLPGQGSTGLRSTMGPETNGSFLLAVGLDEEPCRFDVTGDVVACQIPADILALRERGPHKANRWRHELRDALGGALSDGYVIQEFTRSGCYILTRGQSRNLS